MENKPGQMPCPIRKPPACFSRRHRRPVRLGGGTAGTRTTTFVSVLMDEGDVRSDLYTPSLYAYTRCMYIHTRADAYDTHETVGDKRKPNSRDEPVIGYITRLFYNDRLFRRLEKNEGSEEDNCTATVESSLTSFRNRRSKKSRSKSKGTKRGCVKKNQNILVSWIFYIT